MILIFQGYSTSCIIMSLEDICSSIR